jgi:hypothetical protein
MHYDLTGDYGNYCITEMLRRASQRRWWERTLDSLNGWFWRVVGA